MDLGTVKTKLRNLKAAASELAGKSGADKNAALLATADAVLKETPAILAANRRDVEARRAAGTAEHIIDRLLLNEERVKDAAEGIKTVAALESPLGKILEKRVLKSGVLLEKITVPLGVAAVIYEARPLVALDAFALCYKSGNALLLRGSSLSRESNRAIFSALKKGLERCAQSVSGALELSEAEGEGREDVEEILCARGLVDVVVPRGGRALIANVVENSRVPVIETGSGVCHIYIDRAADIGMAVGIAENGKLQRPSVCNALECAVVHRDILAPFLRELEKRFAGRAELRCDSESFAFFENEAAGATGAGGAAAKAAKKLPAYIKRAREEDFGFEFLSPILAIKTVVSLDEAIDFINSHNTKHSDVIITEDADAASKFLSKIDSACVYWNASSRFSDGGEFGLGAEIGISTQKLHARGPMGLAALTTTKYILRGRGETR